MRLVRLGVERIFDGHRRLDAVAVAGEEARPREASHRLPPAPVVSRLHDAMPRCLDRVASPRAKPSPPSSPSIPPTNPSPAPATTTPTSNQATDLEPSKMSSGAGRNKVGLQFPVGPITHCFAGPGAGGSSSGGDGSAYNDERRRLLLSRSRSDMSAIGGTRTRSSLASSSRHTPPSRAPARCVPDRHTSMPCSASCCLETRARKWLTWDPRI